MRRRRPGRRPDHPAPELNQTESALLVPVPEAEPVVGPWRKRYSLDERRGVPAHITVLYPFVRPEELSEEIEEGLRSLFAGLTSFEFRLARTARFPELLYLAPEPASRFLALTEAVIARYPGYQPYGGVFDEVIPHLTVADCEQPGLCGDPNAVMDEVERAIVGEIPIEARAHEVVLMTGDARWTVRARFPLGG